MQALGTATSSHSNGKPLVCFPSVRIDSSTPPDLDHMSRVLAQDNEHTRILVGRRSLVSCEANCIGYSSRLRE